MGRFSWLGGKDDAKSDEQSAARARSHRRSIAKTAAAAERREDADRRRFGLTPTYRRNGR